MNRPLVQVVNAERIIVLSWGRAVLAQLAHPLVAAGVAEHSTFARNPRTGLQRFQATVRAMRALTFGPKDRAQAAAARIRKAHTRVHGVLSESSGRYPAGTPYSAAHPALLTWVHATTVEATLTAYTLFVAPLEPSAQDQYCQEATAMEDWLGLAPGTFPGTWAAVEDLIARAREDGTLSITPMARALARFVLEPPQPRWQAPGVALWQLLTLGLLPGWLREMYGFPWKAKDEKRYVQLTNWINRLWIRLPLAFRHWPEARTSKSLSVPPPPFSSQKPQYRPFPQRD